MSDRNRYRSSGPSGPTLIGPYWACGTRRYSACPPGTDPYIEENPNSAAPLFCSRTCVVSHCDCNPVRAHEAVPAGDVERDDNPVPHGDVGDLRTDLLHDAHRLVAQDVAGFHVRAQHLIQVQIGSTDRRRGDLDDGIRRDSRSAGPGPPPRARPVCPARSRPSSGPLPHRRPSVDRSWVGSTRSGYTANPADDRRRAVGTSGSDQAAPDTPSTVNISATASAFRVSVATRYRW